MAYDAGGRLQTYKTTTNQGEQLATHFSYDQTGRIARIETPWHLEQRTYKQEGSLERVAVERQGSRSMQTFDNKGRPLTRVGYDGGRTQWLYALEKNGGALQRLELPNGEAVNFSGTNLEIQNKTSIRLGHSRVQTERDTKRRIASIIWEAGPVNNNR